MGMFSWKCKGCGGELVGDELVRIAGFTGIYDGYGRVDGLRGGEFDTEGEDFPCWHEKCYQAATPEAKADEKPSDHAPNQGFGWPMADFVPEFEPGDFIIVGELDVVEGDYENIRFESRNYNQEGKYMSYRCEEPGDCTPMSFATEDEAIRTAQGKALQGVKRATVVARDAEGNNQGMITSIENPEEIEKSIRDMDRYFARNG